MCLDEEEDNKEEDSEALLLGCRAPSAIIDAILGFCSLDDRV